MPVIKVKRKDVLRQKEIEATLKQADPRMQCLIGLLWGFGKRISENLLLEREEIYIEKGFLMVRFHVLKKRVKDQVYLKALNINHPAVAYILPYLDTVKEGPIFPGLTRQLALYYLKKINPNSYLHLFRRSLATEMSEHSYTVQQLMSWFDWTEPDVAVDYVQKGPGLTKELSERTW
jgi:integrase